MLLNLCEILAWCTKTFGKDCNYKNEAFSTFTLRMCKYNNCVIRKVSSIQRGRWRGRARKMAILPLPNDFLKLFQLKITENLSEKKGFVRVLSIAFDNVTIVFSWFSTNAYLKLP